ncbi:MAG: molybdate ABC transporter substrate-binding protein [Peptococcaceae bacterium]
MYYNGKARMWVLTALVVVLIGLLFLGGCSSEVADKQEEPKAPEEPQALFAYVGANLKDPVTDLAQAYEEETGVKVELTFNNSGALLNQVTTMQKGDIYMPGGMPFVEQAKEKGHIDQVAGPIAYHTPVIITPTGNPARISAIEDLAKEDVKLVIPDKDATAIGKTIYKIFNKIGKTAEIEKQIIANLETPAKVLAAITMGQGNAGIVEYSNTLKARDQLEVVEIDPGVNEIQEIPIASLVYAADKELAADFLKYVQENGPEAFAKHGFKTEKS